MLWLLLASQTELTESVEGILMEQDLARLKIQFAVSILISQYVFQTDSNTVLD